VSWAIFLGFLASVMDVDASEPSSGPPAEKKAKLDEDLTGLFNQSYVMQPTHVPKEGTLYGANVITLKANGSVTANGGAEHGRWFLISGDVLSLAWDWQGRSNARTGVYRRIPGTRSWLQTDATSYWQLVMVPYEPT
jgi:hypothetical protein